MGGSVICRIKTFIWFTQDSLRQENMSLSLDDLRWPKTLCTLLLNYRSWFSTTAYTPLKGIYCSHTILKSYHWLICWSSWTLSAYTSHQLKTASFKLGTFLAPTGNAIKPASFPPMGNSLQFATDREHFQRGSVEVTGANFILRYVNTGSSKSINAYEAGERGRWTGCLYPRQYPHSIISSWISFLHLYIWISIRSWKKFFKTGKLPILQRQYFKKQAGQQLLIGLTNLFWFTVSHHFLISINASHSLFL